MRSKRKLKVPIDHIPLTTSFLTDACTIALASLLCPADPGSTANFVKVPESEFKDGPQGLKYYDVTEGTGTGQCLLSQM